MTRAPSQETIAGRFNHPPFLKTLFIAEAAGNFSHYGMRNLLVLYMIDALLFQDERAFSVYASFVAILYITPMVGGLLADRYMTLKQLIYMGSILIVLGTILLSFPWEHAFYFGISVVAIGYGLYRPSVLRVLSKIYSPDDPRREAGFTIFFTAANLGPLLASLMCGWVAVTYGWQWGFISAASSMLVTIGVFLKNNDFMDALDEGHAQSPKFKKMGPILGFFVPATLIFSSIAGYLIYQPGLFHGVVLTISSMIVLYLGFVMVKLNQAMRLRVLVILILLSYHTLFFAFFEQLSSSVTLFTDRVVIREVFNFTIPTLWFQGLNPTFIVLLGPLISSVWIYLRKKNRDFSVALKFTAAFLMIALGFIVLAYGASVADCRGGVSLSFLIFGVFLHSLGEILISPIGLSAITQLSPVHLNGFFIGLFYFSVAIGNYVAGGIAKWTAFDKQPGQIIRAIDCVGIYQDVFWKIGGYALLVCFTILIFYQFINNRLIRT